MIVTHQNAEQLDFNKGSGLMVAIANFNPFVKVKAI